MTLGGAEMLTNEQVAFLTNEMGIIAENVEKMVSANTQQ